MNRMLQYSAKKIKANPPLLYSTLNPETNSDSPSAKSKGLRFVSAKLEISQQTVKGAPTPKNHTYCWYFKKSPNLKAPVKPTKNNKIKAKLTS